MKGKMLIVDDDPMIIKLLEKKLTNAGFITDSAHDGQEALEKIEFFKPDIIISDIMMPRLDGYELYKSLRQNPETASIPFVFLSAKALPSEQLEGLRMGADEYVCKPIDFNDLIERVHHVMQRSAALNSNSTRPDFSGNLTRIKLVDILQLIESNLKTGEFVIKNQIGKIKGKVFFKYGNLINAQTGQLTGEEAFFELMGETRGFFEFFSSPIEIPEKIKEPNMSVLLNGTRLIDEAQGLSALIPDTSCRFRIINRNVSSELENKIGKDNIDHILEMVDQNKMCHQIINDCFKSKPRISSTLIHLIKEQILEIQKSNDTPKVQLDNILIHKIHEIYSKGSTGILYLTKNDADAFIYFQDGEIIHASYGMASGKKALFRIFCEKGWELNFSEEPVSVDKSIEEPLNKLLIDASRDQEGLKLFDDDLLSQSVSIRENDPDKIKVPGDQNSFMPILELAKTHESIRDILDYSPYTDLKTLKILLELIHYKVMDISKR